MSTIGLRREDKSEWEGRVPLVPDDVRQLVGQGIRVQVQRSTIRAISDDDYRAAGAEIVDDLSDAPIVLGVKEIPPAKLEPGKAYVYFSHTIKGQPENMPALARLIETGCTLIDYERITDEKGRRLVFFGRFAGLAGMIDTLWTLGQRLAHEGIETPFATIQPAHRYRTLEDARHAITAVGEAIRRDGLPASITPFACGFAGYGQVGQGAQEVFDWLPVTELSPDQLADAAADNHTCYKVVFREEHLARRRDDSPFQLQDYYDHPERYEGLFFPHAKHLGVLVNCIYWEPRYPKLIDEEQFRALYAPAESPRLRVVGDITCDIDGSLACTTHSTTPGQPVYVYDPATRKTEPGVSGRGPVVLAVDFLPCELPVDASIHFSHSLAPFIPDLARADLARPLDATGLPPELVRATVVHQGKLTEPFRSLEKHLA